METYDWRVDLRLDAVYYYSARMHFESAQKHYEPLKQVIDKIYEIDRKINEIEARYKNPVDAYDEIESYSIQLDSLYSSMAFEYIPVIRDIALVHILNALCLEAYINIVASEKIVPKSSFDEFDKLSLEGKWLFLPKLLGKNETFDRGAEPLNGFRNIVKWRNGLVHFKRRSDPWRGYLPPQFFDQFGLEINCAQKSCTTTTDMIKTLSRFCNLSEPEWLNEKYWDAFEFKL